MVGNLKKIMFAFDLFEFVRMIKLILKKTLNRKLTKRVMKFAQIFHL